MSVPTLRRSPNGTIYMHWTDPAAVKGQRGRSRRQSTGTSEMDAAKVYLGQWLLMERSEAAEPGKALTVADLWSLYDKRHVQLKVAAPGAIESLWKNLEPHFGRFTLSEIDDNIVSQYETKRAAGVIGFPSVSATVRRELVALRACLNWCAKPARKIIDKKDLPDFDLPAAGEARDRWLTIDEIQRLLTTAATLRRDARLSRVERFLWLALETGSRKTAIAELTWSRVDFDNDTIDYNVPGRRRTKKRRGVTPISKALRPVLERMKAERLPDCDLVLDTDVDVWEALGAVARKAGVAGVSPHVLRHTAATHMVRRGVPIFKVAKILAISVAMAERVYAHHCPDDLREAVDTISAGVLEAAE